MSQQAVSIPIFSCVLRKLDSLEVRSHVNLICHDYLPQLLPLHLIVYILASEFHSAAEHTPWAFKIFLRLQLLVDNAVIIIRLCSCMFQWTGLWSWMYSQSLRSSPAVAAPVTTQPYLSGHSYFPLKVVERRRTIQAVAGCTWMLLA